jgi:hypothetical protein
MLAPCASARLAKRLYWNDRRPARAAGQYEGGGALNAKANGLAGQEFAARTIEQDRAGLRRIDIDPRLLFTARAPWSISSAPRRTRIAVAPFKISTAGAAGASPSHGSTRPEARP